MSSVFSSNQDETSYEDSEDHELGLENSIMEVHIQYDLRSKKNQENSRKNNLDAIVKKSPENILKRIADNDNTTAKKTDPNTDKTSQPSINTSCPSTSASGLEKTLLKKALNQNHQIKNVD